MNAVRFKQIKELADHDGPTLLLNHRTLLFFDLDDFKAINDKFGHIEGDKVLVKFASLLKKTCRMIDIPARYGGEEFCLLLPETDIKNAKMIAERIRKDVEEEAFLSTGDRITVSCGISSLSKDCQDMNPDGAC
ncbi:MAG: GGDEF domain-containing protein [bacterium]